MCTPSPDLRTVQWKPTVNFPKMLKSMRRTTSAKRTEIAYSISVTRETLILTISECPKIYECTNIFNSFLILCCFTLLILIIFWTQRNSRSFYQVQASRRRSDSLDSLNSYLEANAKAMTLNFHSCYNQSSLWHIGKCRKVSSSFSVLRLRPWEPVLSSWRPQHEWGLRHWDTFSNISW